MAARTTAAPVMARDPSGALREVGAAHGRTLLSAIDAHVGSLRHTRPWLVARREALLEDVADAWLAAGGGNWLPDLDRAWLAGRLAALPAPRRAPEAQAVADLMAWAVAQGLLPPDDENPGSGVLRR